MSVVKFWTYPSVTSLSLTNANYDGGEPYYQVEFDMFNNQGGVSCTRNDVRQYLTGKKIVPTFHREVLCEDLFWALEETKCKRVVMKRVTKVNIPGATEFFRRNYDARLVLMEISMDIFVKIYVWLRYFQSSLFFHGYVHSLKLASCLGLAKLVYIGNLTTLQLYQCRIAYKNSLILAKCLGNTTIESLSISMLPSRCSKGISSAGSVYSIQYFSWSPHLNSIFLHPLSNCVKCLNTRILIDNLHQKYAYACFRLANQKVKVGGVRKVNPFFLKKYD